MTVKRKGSDVRETGITVGDIALNYKSSESDKIPQSDR